MIMTKSRKHFLHQMQIVFVQLRFYYLYAPGNRILISLFTELRILKCQCSDERCVQTGWIEQSMETCSVFSPLIRYLGVSTCFYLYYLFVYILYFLHCFVFICTLFVFLFCCSIWMNKAINRSLFHFSVTVDLLDCV